jgi:enoyl-CoA hydratase/carnithine racemase
VVPADKLMDETLAIAAQIASYSLPVVMKVKEAVNRAYESSLAEGLLFERREFPRDVRARRPEGRHARVRREAQAVVQAPLTRTIGAALSDRR